MARSSREEWSKRVARWTASDLTAKEFASEMGLNARTLTYWKWRLGKEAKGVTTARPKPKPTLSKPTFIELPRAPLSTGALELIVDERFTVRVSSGFDADALSALLDVLESRR